MFEEMNEAQARLKMSEIVKEYYETFMKTPDYSYGDRIPYARRVFDESEVINLVDAGLDFWLTAGRYTASFEREFASYLGIKYVSLVNSGSSANLLAFMALTSPLLGERKIEPGDEVICVAASFPTTVAPIIQYGAVPVFVDIKIPSYNIDVSYLSAALSSKTKAVFIAHTMGNPFDIKAVTDFCKANNLWLIEDNCDALGSMYSLDGKISFTGTFGDIGTSSFYPPHHMTMGEGGAVYTDNPLLNKIIRSMRDWGRDCVCPPGVDNCCGDRFSDEKTYGQMPKGYDHKYVYSHFGYNLKATDMGAAVGLAQLEKLDGFCQKRRENFDSLYEKLQVISDRIILPEKTCNSDPSWFGFIITCREGISRDMVVKYLEKRGVQTRELFAGNIIRQPLFDSVRGDYSKYRVIGDLRVTDQVLNNSFWVGVYPGINDDMICYMADSIIEAVGSKG